MVVAWVMLPIGTHLAGAAGLWTTVMIDCFVRLVASGQDEDDFTSFRSPSPVELRSLRRTSIEDRISRLMRRNPDPLLDRQE